MSAFVVSDDHIRLIVATALEGPVDHNRDSSYGRWSEDTLRWYTMDIDKLSFEEIKRVQRQATPEVTSDMCRMLLSENVRSVCYRYECEKEQEYSTNIENIQYALPRNLLTSVEAFKAINCYAYQSCEHPEWKTSEAKRFCEALKGKIITFLPGYDTAKWSW